MKKLTCKLIETTTNQRFYKLNYPITKGYNRLFGKEVDINKEIKAEIKNYKEDFKQYAPKECNIICISDANSHAERLVFAGLWFILNGKKTYGRTETQIEGCHTMMIHGGDPSSMKNDMVYIRLLAKLNGYEFKLNQPCT